MNQNPNNNNNNSPFDKRPGMPPSRNPLFGPGKYLLIILALVVVVFMFSNQNATITPERSYSELLADVEADKIADVAIQSTRLVARAKDSQIPQDAFPGRYDYSVQIPSSETFYEDVDAIYAKKLEKATDEVSPVDYKFGIKVLAPATVAWWMELIPLGVMLLLFGLLGFFIMRQQTGGNRGVMNFGKSHAHMTDPTKNNVKFGDVAGADEEKAELAEIVEFLKNPDRFLKLGAKIPKGVLLVGPPGTGKTLLARAVAGEAGVPFFFISGSDFVEMFVGVGASRVRDLFNEAKKNAPAILFIDEIDAVGRQRGTGLGGGHDEREQTLNQMLVEMDGFTANEGVIVLAATNRADVLDPALLRPGRFDRQITVSYPDIKGREEILKVHSRNKPLDSTVDLKTLARRTPYFTGADLANILNEGAILAARNHHTVITMDDIEEAITRVSVGPEKKSRVVTEKDKRLVAYHEAGHAVVSYNIPECDPVHEVSIIPRGSAGGYTMTLPEEEVHYINRARIYAQIAELMGGRCAEEIIMGDVSTGPSSDIKRATELARNMITEYGMSDTLGPMYLGGDHEVFLGRDFAQNRNYSENVASMVDQEMRRILDQAYQRAENILRTNIDKLHALAAALIEREKVDGEEFLAIMRSGNSALPEAASNDRRDAGQYAPAAEGKADAINPNAAADESKNDAAPAAAEESKRDAAPAAAAEGQPAEDTAPAAATSGEQTASDGACAADDSATDEGQLPGASAGE